MANDHSGDHFDGGRAGYISPVQDAEHPVKLTSKRDGSEEFTTVPYAVDRLSGYYDLSPEEIEEGLRGGTPFQTMSFIYRIS